MYSPKGKTYNAICYWDVECKQSATSSIKVAQFLFYFQQVDDWWNYLKVRFLWLKKYEKLGKEEICQLFFPRPSILTMEKLSRLQHKLPITLLELVPSPLRCKFHIDLQQRGNSNRNQKAADFLNESIHFYYSLKCLEKISNWIVATPARKCN